MSLLQTQTIQSNNETKNSKLVSTSTPVLPAIDIEHSELVLHDDDGNISSSTQFEELSVYGGSSANICPAAISVENSNDVIIGPVTQFHGNVTIYQNVNGPQAIDNNTTHSNNNGKLVKSESTSSDSSQIANPSFKALLKSNNVKFILLGLFLLLIGVVVTICVMFLTPLNHARQPSPQEAHKPSTSPPTESPNSSPDPENAIGRNQWGGRPPKYTKPLAHPTPLVIISHTATQYCDTFATCSNQMASIQSYHVGNFGSPDIGYNFLIGGDANVYVGRGWDTVNFHTNNSIGICFIGNYVYDNLTPDMMQSALHLLEEGVNKGKLAQNYTLVAHNQTYATQSPGANVYRVIKFWPHFSPKLVR